MRKYLFLFITISVTVGFIKYRFRTIKCLNESLNVGMFTKVALFFLFLFYILYADVDTIFQSVFDARSLSLGTAYTADYNGSYSMFTNPAGVVSTDKYEFAGTVIMHPLSRKGFLSSTMQVKKNVFSGIGWINSSTEIEITDRENFITKKDFVTNIYLISLGVNFFFPAGVSFKYVHETFDKFTISGLVVDTGVLYNLSSTISLGMVIKNLSFTKPSGKSYWNEEKIEEEIPVRIRVGGRLTLPIKFSNEDISIDTKTVFSLDVENSLKDNELKLYPGMEFLLHNTIALRCGLLSGKGLTLGVALMYKNIDISFGSLFNETLTHTHTISLRII